MKKESLLLGTGLILIIGSAYVHGVLTDRWGLPPDLSAASAKFDGIPHVVGDWHSVPLEISEAQLRGAEAVGHFARIYRNDQTQVEIQVMILCGPHGPIAVHPPTICFTGAGWQQTYPEEPQEIKSDGGQATFWKTVFTRLAADGMRSDLDTYWAWSDDGEWEAPENPRMEFANRPHLYKMYVTRHRGASADAKMKESAEPPCEEFLKVFLPTVRAALSKS
jgi:hypothetical protein